MPSDLFASVAVSSASQDQPGSAELRGPSWHGASLPLDHCPPVSDSLTCKENGTSVISVYTIFEVGCQHESDVFVH